MSKHKNKRSQHLSTQLLERRSEEWRGQVRHLVAGESVVVLERLLKSVVKCVFVSEGVFDAGNGCF